MNFQVSDILLDSETFYKSVSHALFVLFVCVF